jgi:hypothetical protein
MDHPAPFTVSACGGGGLSWKAASSRRFISPTRGTRLARVYADDHKSILAAHALTLSVDGFLCNASAGILWDFPLPYRLINGPVVSAVPEMRAHARRRQAKGRRLNIVLEELTTLDSLPVTTPARTFVDLARDLSVPDLVAVGDDAIARALMSPEEVDEVIRRRIRFVGKRRAQAALPILDSRSESPQESRTRAHCVLAGFGTPCLQWEVYDEFGVFVARVDLAYPAVRVAIEYDGEYHASQERRDRDAARRTRLRSLGWYIVELTAHDLRHPQLLLTKVSTAMGVQLSTLQKLEKG